MYQIKDADRMYWNQRIHEALEKIDWDAMNKHLHTKHARRQYQATKTKVCSFIHSNTTGLVECAKYKDLAYYDKLIYAARKKSTPDHFFTDKLPWIQAKGAMLKKTRVLRGVGAAAIGLTLGLGGLANAANEKRSVKSTG